MANKENQQVATITVDVQLQPNGKYEIYLSTEGSSGAKYTDLTADKIGEHVADLVGCYVEAME